MKVLAIIDVKPGTDLATLRNQLPDELRGSWALFAGDVLREAYATSTPARVVFVLEAESAAAASAHLRGLPLIAAGMLQLEIIELRPFVNWSALFAHRVTSSNDAP